MPAGLSHKMVTQETSSTGDVGRHLLCRGSGWCWWYFYTVNVFRKKGSSANMPLPPKAMHLSPLLGAKSVTQCSWHSLCPRYTGEIPATYAGPS